MNIKGKFYVTYRVNTEWNLSLITFYARILTISTLEIHIDDSALKSMLKIGKINFQ